MRLAVDALPHSPIRPRPEASRNPRQPVACRDRHLRIQSHYAEPIQPRDTCLTPVSAVGGHSVAETTGSGQVARR